MQEPEKLEVEKSGKKKKERPPFAHRNPPDMTKFELQCMVGKLMDKVEGQSIIIKEQKNVWKMAEMMEKEGKRISSFTNRETASFKKWRKNAFV